MVLTVAIKIKIDLICFTFVSISKLVFQKNYVANLTQLISTFVIFIYTYIKMFKDSSAKYYQEKRT